MPECKNCHFDNYQGTKYCQRCGNFIQDKINLFDGDNLMFIAGTSAKDVSIAPIAAMTIENQIRQEDMEHVVQSTVRVVPLADGTWFCPDCGEHNLIHDMFCKGCGKDKS